MSPSSHVAEPRFLELEVDRFSARQIEVLDVVEAVFLREGIRGVRMGQLADEASCSRSTLYELASSKEDLLLLVLDRIMRRVTKRGADAIARAVDPVDKIRALLITGAVELAELGPHFLGSIGRHPPARLLFDRWVGAGLQDLQELIEDAVRTRDFRPVNAQVIAEASFAVLLRFVDPSFAHATKVTATGGLAELIDVLVDGLRPRATPHPT